MSHLKAQVHLALVNFSLLVHPVLSSQSASQSAGRLLEVTGERDADRNSGNLLAVNRKSELSTVNCDIRDDKMF